MILLLFAVNMAISYDPSTTIEVCCQNVPLLSNLAFFKKCGFISKTALGLSTRSRCVVLKWRSKCESCISSLLKVLQHISFWRDMYPNLIYSSKYFRNASLIVNCLMCSRQHKYVNYIKGRCKVIPRPKLECIE